MLPFTLALSIASCSNPGDEISYEDLQGGTYVVVSNDLPDAAPAVSVAFDLAAGTYTVAEAGGESFSGELMTLPEEQWTTCCYLNGTGHTKFETVVLPPFALAGSGLDMAMPRITADGPSLFDAENGVNPDDDGNPEVYSLTAQ